MPNIAKTGRILLYSLLAVITLVVVTVGIAVYTVLTPERLTPIVRRVAGEYLTCESRLSRAELTIVSTFPYVGVQVDDLLLLHPMEGAQSDTLVDVSRMTIALDIKKVIDGDIHIRALQMEDAAANIYLAADGQTNLSILREDTTEQATDEDEEGWHIRSLSWEQDLYANIRSLSIRDMQDSIEGRLSDVRLHVKQDSSICLSGQADIAPIRLKVQGTIRPQSIDPLSLTMQLHAETNEFDIQEALALVPDSIWSMPDSIEANGRLRLSADIRGTYSNDSMPRVAAGIDLSDAWARYAGVPYTIRDLRGHADAYIDMNDSTASHVRLEDWHARAENSTIDLNGNVTDLFGDMHIEAIADAKVRIADFRDYIPENMKVSGEVALHADADLRMSEIEKGAILHRDLLAQAAINELDLTMNDSIAVRSERMNLDIVLPTGCTAELIRAKALIEMSDLHLMMTDGPKAELGQTTIHIHGEYDTQDSTVIPLFDGAFFTTELRAEMDTIRTYLVAPKGGISLSSSRRDKSEPRLTATIAADSIWAKMGALIEASTQRLTMKASARHRSGKDNILLEWNPRLDFDVHRAVADVQGIPYTVYVPEIRFNYSNRDFTIDTSRVELGNSNFNLSGQVTNIGAYMENKGLLTGKLRFTSSYTDVNQLLDLVNGFGNDPSELDATDASLPMDTLSGKLGQIKTQEANPFIVPKGVDMSIYTHIDTASAFGETIRHVGGQLDCRDGVMTLQQMGFMCDAATMQLTGIYKTPRRNHLFAGFDFHLTNVRIAEMINMIPQVDSLLPMLRSFRGTGQIHIAAETYTNAYYQIKPSTTRGALSIEAKDLTLLDGETFSKIAKILRFKKSRENKIDSISADIGLYKNMVTVYPFLLHYGPWKVAAGGEHSLSGQFNYHIDVLRPIYLGADVQSKTKKNGETGLKIGLAKCRYKQDFIPTKTGIVDTQAMSIRALINQALKDRVQPTEITNNNNEIE